MKNKTLEVFERIFSSHWFLTSYNGIGFVRDFPKIGGGNYVSKIVYVMENDMCRYLFDKNEFEKGAQFTADKLINNHTWRREIYKKIDYFTKEYFNAGERLRQTDLFKLSDTELIGMVKRIIYFQHYHQVYSVLANGVMLDGRNHLSNKIQEELQKFLRYPKIFSNYWAMLTQVPRMSLRQEKDHAIALLARQAKIQTKAAIELKLRVIYEQYCWLDYNNMGPAASLDGFRKELRNAVRNNKHIRLPKELKALQRKQERLMSTLGFTSREKFLINLAQGVIWQKGYRKDVQYHGFYCYEQLFKELARRRKVVDWQDLAFMFPWEVESFIRKNLPRVSALKLRRKFSVFIVDKRNLTIKIGAPAQRFAKQLGLIEDLSYLRETNGQCAYIGTVQGTVRVIQTPSDMVKMHKGDILVSQATSPDLLPAMKLAGAIVTNTGGLICHAAITARELKIPCVVGTANATLIFKDGDRVEVNAAKGIIKKI